MITKVLYQRTRKLIAKNKSFYLILKFKTKILKTMQKVEI